MNPFWCYYGGKFRAAPRYPRPRHGTIVEPFAGAAGYALRHSACRVVLVEEYPVVAELWRYLIGVSAAEVRRIPLVECVDDLPAWVPAGGRALVGFAMNNGTASPRRTLSAGLRALRATGRRYCGWSEAHRERVASQVDAIRHWQIVEGDYTAAPDIEATWFIDPPYQGAGVHYVHGPAGIDYRALGEWCRTRCGQVIACENEGADWLPFRPFATLKGGPHSAGSREVIWTAA